MNTSNRPIMIFVLTGQSNSLGTAGDPEEKDYSPGASPFDERIPFFWRNRSGRGGDGPAVLYGDSGGKILTLRAQQGEGINPLFWGPEIGFGRRLAEAGLSDFLIVKASRGGGGNGFWLKGSANDQMYRHVVETVQHAVVALAPGTAYEIAALLYVQGESDGEQEFVLAGERLRLLAENLRKDLPNAGKMRVLIGGIAAPGRTRDTVREQQAALAKLDPSFRYVDNLDLRSQLYDNLHFNKTGKLEVGRRLAEAWLAWSGEKANVNPAVRIVTLGDSITKGVRSGVKKEETFAFRLEVALLAEGLNVELINVGIGGERTDQALLRMKKDIVARKPDFVTIMYGTNDSHVDPGKDSSRLTVAQYRENLEVLVGQLREAGITPILMTSPRWGRAGLDGTGVNPNLQLEKYVEVCREIAAKLEVALVDHFRHWTQAEVAGTDVGGWTTDQCHPNPEGHRILAETILPVIRPIIRNLNR